MTEPSEAAKRAWADACDVVMGSACGDPDCEECKAAALVIERAMTERDRALREVLTEVTSELEHAHSILRQRMGSNNVGREAAISKSLAILASTGDADNG